MELPTRRTVLWGLLGTGMLACTGLASRIFAGNNPLLRPPGAQDEVTFLSLCLKCDRCRSICPRDCITTATIEDGLANARTPRMDFHKGYCDFCGRCAEVCPTGAIAAYTDVPYQNIGLAVIDRNECIAFQGSGCQKCFDACPYEAIELNGSIPVVLEDACNGCGLCENVCPSGSLLSFSGSRDRRGINVTVRDRVSS
ncbi:4Fe-4S dicluster domain-containing protein [Cryptobacterium curtum]|uniref:4Fe-4S dicluster domain-containing protein n=1 Tax=Cryptobacterium curtum TaxID=84163 RepID=UPI0028D5C75E|nr:4Fe-4S dicluster domain-containing protein [Cryptobacterium curtum]